MPALKKFFDRHTVTIVLLGLIVAGHWSWYRLQFVENLVSEEERKDLPIMKAIDSYKAKLFPSTKESSEE